MVYNMYPLSPQPTPTSNSFAHCKMQRLLGVLTPTCWAVAKLQPFSGRSEGRVEAGDLGLDSDGKREMRPPARSPCDHGEPRMDVFYVQSRDLIFPSSR